MKNKVKKYFISGILTALPILFIYLVAKSFSGFIIDFFPELNMFYSLVIFVFFIAILGFFVTNFLSRKIKKKVKDFSKKKGLLSTVAKFFLNIDEITTNTKKIFEKPVLYKVDDGIYELGYVSNESFDFLELESEKSEADPEKDSVWVYIPTPFNFMGSIKLVEKRKIRKIKNENREEISLFILSAGITKN